MAKPYELPNAAEIPLRSLRRKPKPVLPRLFDSPKYRQRTCIERIFGWLKENRRIVTRFDKLTKVTRRWFCWPVLYGVYDINFRAERSKG